jgi:hypothetical protein
VFTSLPRETDDEAVAALVRLSTLVRNSLIVRGCRRPLRVVAAAWQRSATVRRCRLVAALELHERVQLIGWIVLVAGLTAGAGAVLFAGPWSGLSALLWFVVLAFGSTMVSRPRDVAVAWLNYRAR